MPLRRLNLDKWGKAMNTKYIITYEGSAVVFGPDLTHAEVAQKFYGKCRSAGFVKIYAKDKYDIRVDCYGGSVSLGINSRPEEDEQIVLRMITGEY